MAPRMIDRDPSLSEQEDFERNVRPVIPEGMVAERLYTWPDPPEEPQMSGWWIIPENFYDIVEAIIEDDEE
jgi:hypothetical protein